MVSPVGQSQISMCSVSTTSSPATRCRRLIAQASGAFPHARVRRLTISSGPWATSSSGVVTSVYSPSGAGEVGGRRREVGTVEIGPEGLDEGAVVVGSRHSASSFSCSWPWCHAARFPSIGRRRSGIVTFATDPQPGPRSTSQEPGLTCRFHGGGAHTRRSGRGRPRPWLARRSGGRPLPPRDPQLYVVYAVTLFVQRTGHVWPVVDNQLVAAFEGRVGPRLPGRGPPSSAGAPGGPAARHGLAGLGPRRRGPHRRILAFHPVGDSGRPLRGLLPAGLPGPGRARAVRGGAHQTERLARRCHGGPRCDRHLRRHRTGPHPRLSRRERGRPGVHDRRPGATTRSPSERSWSCHGTSRACCSSPPAVR